MGKGRVTGDLAANLLPVLLVGLARAWLSYEKNVGDPKTEALRDLMEKKVMPAAGRALSEHWRYAEELTAKSPEFPVYANITIDLDLARDKVKDPDDLYPPPSVSPDSFKHAVDARFVDLRLSFNNISKKETIDLAGARHPTETQRVTYSAEIIFGETPAQHTSRVLAHDAAAVARRGIPARDVLEHSKFAEDLTPADAREEQRRQRVGLPSLAKERERQQRKQWVLAYIDYTFEHDLDKQWSDAVRYLKELEQRDAAEEAAERAGPIAPAPPVRAPLSRWPRAGQP